MQWRTAWVVLVLVACGPAVDVGDTDAGTGDGTTGNSAGTAATMTASTMDSGQDVTGTTTPTTSATTASTTASTTVDPGGCGDDFVAGCQSACAAIVTCDPGQGPYETCVTTCVDALVEETAECQKATCDQLACVGGLGCDAINAGAVECAPYEDVVAEVCSDGADSCYIGGGKGTCEWGCDGIGHRIVCDVELCQCYEKDEPTFTCPAAGICDDLGALADFADSCCGW